MGEQREQDQFYIVPTSVVRQAIAARKKDFLRITKRNGEPRRDVGHWTLRLKERKDRRQEGGWGLEQQWKAYLNGWRALDESGSRIGA